jgi:hypothetical protein
VRPSLPNPTRAGLARSAARTATIPARPNKPQAGPLHDGGRDITRHGRAD